MSTIKPGRSPGNTQYVSGKPAVPGQRITRPMQDARICATAPLMYEGRECRLSKPTTALHINGAASGWVAKERIEVSSPNRPLKFRVEYIYEDPAVPVTSLEQTGHRQDKATYTYSSLWIPA